MSTVIGTVTLDNDMIFSDEYDYSLINASVANTIGGGVVIQEFDAVEKGRPITLISTETQGLQTKAVVDSLKALADSGANNTYTLTIISNALTFTKTVRFRNELGAVKAEPMQVRDGLHSDTIWYRMEIFLMVM